MKYIGKLKVPVTNDNVLDFGKGYIEWVAIIEEKGDGTYSVALHEDFGGGELGDDQLIGTRASGLGAAKRRLIKDRGWKSKDFAWEKVDV